MRRWLADHLRSLSPHRNAVLIDPDRILTEADRETLAETGCVTVTTTWVELRRVYEIKGRARASDRPRLIIVVQDASVREARDLPYDIEQSTSVLRLRVPVPAQLEELVVALSDDLQDAAVTVLRNNRSDPVGALLASIWGVVLPPNGGTTVQELDAVVRLRTASTVPHELWSFVRNRLKTPAAQDLTQEPPRFDRLQNAWESWVAEGSSSAWAGLFEEFGNRIGLLFHAGLLQPTPASREGLPTWAVVGVRDRTWDERLDALLSTRPEPHVPDDAVSWTRTAEWWGEVRAAIARGTGYAGLTSAEWHSHWELWSDLDATFSVWLRRQFGGLMFHAGAWPSTVDRIAPFLARRLRQNAAQRVALVVLDGMAFAQWSMLRDVTRIATLASGGVFAMIPTLTPVSRQAIFAGALPSTFANTIRSTAAEEREWLAFWVESGLSPAEIRYVKTTGRTEAHVPDLGAERVLGVVVEAVDEVLHGAKVLGDSQVAVAVELWARLGFLEGLVHRATQAGFEVWLTADHGNIEATGSGRVHEGLAVESAGTRVRWYTDPALREGARVEGLVWDPPGLPTGIVYPLFALKRTAYFSGDLRVTHGGISLDEVIVPFVRVAA